ncbi:MAG: hypothetical protein FWH02_05595 [Oscillospiraceae bacterium]|nr:hypothetical protein [Oscillospiraceae bacterium]
MAFKDVLARMPKEYQDRILETDEFLYALRPMKFKRVPDKNGNKITYVAPDYGVSYMFKVDGGFKHNFQWYIVHSGKPETWHRKSDFMEETLVKISESDLPLAERIFKSLKPCPGFDNCYGERCLARTPYAFNGQKRLTCHGSVYLGLGDDDFSDARKFFRYLNGLIKEKTANGELRAEKIILCKTDRSV